MEWSFAGQRDRAGAAWTGTLLTRILLPRVGASRAPGNQVPAMSTEHAAVARRLYDLINAGDLEGFGRLLADDFIEHEETPGLAPTKDGVLAFFGMQRAAFPDMNMRVEDVVAEGAKVVARVRYTGTHRGEFVGIPATGKGVDAQLIDIFGFGDDGLVHEHWGVMDALAMMQQVGAVPAGPSA